MKKKYEIPDIEDVSVYKWLWWTLPRTLVIITGLGLVYWIVSR